MNRPRFMLYGISGVYNYGCEAILRGTAIVLKELWPKATIQYLSPRPDADAVGLEGSSIQIVPRRLHGRYSPQNFLAKFCSIAGLSWSPFKEKTDYLKDVDLVLSVGGDLYTLFQGGRHSRTLVQYGNMVMRRGIPLVIWGASIGPFEEVPAVKRVMQKHLRKATLITSREPESTEYLRSLGLGAITATCADPAFAVTSEGLAPRAASGPVRIAVNLSPLSTAHTFGVADPKDKAADYAATLAALSREFDAEIVLVPHVVSPWNVNDDDLGFLQHVAGQLPEDVAERVVVLPGGLGFVGTKRELLGCSLVVSARMHCGVNALAAGVPTILLSYSQKAIGMAQYVYGDSRWVLPLSDFTAEKLLPAVRGMLDRKDNLRRHLEGRMPAIQVDVRNAGKALSEVVKKPDR